jgi:17beta-estradiol 17-dehydrogenase / very-long-chain 3-oxoacyl-CoA reductase
LPPGLNLVVISRTPARLEELATELESKYNVEVRSCAIDLSNINMGDLETIKKSFEGLDVGLLVNNAGMSYDHPEYLEAMPAELDMQLIAINTTAPLLLAKLVLPGMKERKKGIIANIGSANGLLPAVPLLCTYAGTKAFINQFSRSLDVELRNFGVRVHDQCPLFVATKMSKIKRARLDAPTPEVWARAAVKQLGYEAVLTPYWFHGLMMAVIQCFAPQWAVVNYIDRLHLGFRKGYYKRLQRKAAEAKKAG